MSSLYSGELINKIYESFNIKILDDTDLPNSVCDKCTIDINTTFRLKQLLIHSQKILANIIKNNEFDEKQIINNLEIKKENIFCNDQNLDDIIKDIVKEELPILTEPKDESDDDVSDVDNIEIDNFELSNNQIVDANIKKTKKFNNYKCTECGRCFRYLSKYKRHRKTHIPKNRPLYNSKAAANHDVNNVENTKIDKSDISTDVTVDASNIEKDEFNNFKCTDCGKCFPYLSKFTRHRKTHIPKIRLYRGKEVINDDVIIDTSTIERDEFGNYKCRECGRCFRFLSKYKRHSKSHMPKNRPLYSCKSCGRAYNLEVNLVKHQEVCDGSSPELKKRTLCNQCGKTVRDLKQHTIIKHSTFKLYECPTCKKRFKHRYDVTKHIRHVHEGVKHKKTHLCNECGQTFRAITFLREHIMTKHLGQKPFKCKLCNAEFRSRDGIHTHMAKHTNTRVRKYACTVCDKKFYTAVVLRNHMRIHTGERPYLCKICEKSYTQSGALHIHMKTHKLFTDINI